MSKNSFHSATEFSNMRPFILVFVSCLTTKPFRKPNRKCIFDESHPEVSKMTLASGMSGGDIEARCSAELTAALQRHLILEQAGRVQVVWGQTGFGASVDTDAESHHLCCT